MAVYVDDMLMEATVNGVTSRWSHLFADTTEELVMFAWKLRLSQAWIQYPGTWKEHFDLTKMVRLKALGLGAINVPIMSQEWVDLQNKKREQAGLPLLVKRVDSANSEPASELTLF